jgi:hypothetical protein
LSACLSFLIPTSDIARSSENSKGKRIAGTNRYVELWIANFHSSKCTCHQETLVIWLYRLQKMRAQNFPFYHWCNEEF